MNIEELARCQRLDKQQTLVMELVMDIHAGDRIASVNILTWLDIMRDHFVAAPVYIPPPSGGDHYTPFEGTATPIGFIRAHKLSFCLGNVVKYVCRYNRKDGGKDLDKALRYARWLMEDAGND